MLFSKEFLSLSLENTEKAESLRLFPWERNQKQGLSPFDTVIRSKYRYFDQKSSMMKDILNGIRKEMGSCVDQFNNTYPNEAKILDCFRRKEDEYRKLELIRETRFANIFDFREKELKNCPSNDFDCIRRVDEEFVWNAAKLPYFFAEN